MDAETENMTPSTTEHDGILESPEEVYQDESVPGNSMADLNDVLPVRASNRPKVPTERMKEYRRQMIERDFAAAKRACTKQVERIESLLQDELVGIAEYQKARGKLESRMNDLHEAHSLLYDTLALEEERIEQNRLYDFSNHRNREALQSLNEKISALQSQRDDLPSIHSSRNSKHSRVSRHSKHSTTSISSLKKRAEMAAKAARLEAELKFHDVESLKTATLKKQEDEIKKLQMVKELAATHAEIEAVDKIQRERYGGLNSLCDEVLSKDNGSEDKLHKYLQS